MRPSRSRSTICAAALAGALSISAGASAAASVTAAVDAIHVSVPARVNRHTVYDVTLTGFSRRHATAYLFIDYASCARSFAAEKRRAPHESDAYMVKGRFDEISGWKSSSSGVDHACAYLVARASGRILASTRHSFRIH